MLEVKNSAVEYFPVQKLITRPVIVLAVDSVQGWYAYVYRCCHFLIATQKKELNRKLTAMDGPIINQR